MGPILAFLKFLRAVLFAYVGKAITDDISTEAITPLRDSLQLKVLLSDQPKPFVRQIFNIFNIYKPFPNIIISALCLYLSR